MALNCLICTSTIYDPLLAIRPNTDSFMKFINVLLSSTSLAVEADSYQNLNNLRNIISKNTAPAPDPDKRQLPSILGTSFVVFCFTCHDKLIEINEMYSKLEEIMNQFYTLANSVRAQLLTPKPTPEIYVVNDNELFKSIRNVFLSELGFNPNDQHQQPKVVSINIDELLPPGINNVEFELKPEMIILDANSRNNASPPDVVPDQEMNDSEPEAVLQGETPTNCERNDADNADFSGIDSDYNPLTENEDDSDSESDSDIEEIPNPAPRSANQKLPNLVKTVRKCSVKLGRRINEVLPIGNSNSKILVPNEFLNSTETLPWTKYRAITHQIYEGGFPKSCPFEGCTSRMYTKNNWYYRRHIVKIHLNQRFPCEAGTGSTTQKEQAREWELPPSVARSIKSYVFPAPCTRTDCRLPSSTMFQNKRALVEHLKEYHYNEVKRQKSVHSSSHLQQILSPDQLDMYKKIELIKNYPAECGIPNCRGRTKAYPHFHSLKIHFLNHHCELQRTFEHSLQIQKSKYSLPDEQLLSRLKGIKTYPVNCPVANCPSKVEYENHDKITNHLKLLHNIYWNWKVELPPKKRKHRRSDWKYILPCPEPNCGRKFHNLRGLEAHRVNEHNKEPSKTFRCPYDQCTREFLSERSLKRHKTLHQKGLPTNKPETIHQCHLCGRNFNANYFLQLHLQRHAAKSNFVCRAQNCGKGFVVATERLKHERGKHWKELGLEPFQCKICGKYFSNAYVLQVHVDVHSGTQKFSCDQCDYKTSRKTDIAEHIGTVHQTDAPWSCEHCGRSYKLERQLKKHMLQHKSQDELFTCDICNKPFRTKRILGIHKANLHGLAVGMFETSVLANL